VQNVSADGIGDEADSSCGPEAGTGAEQHHAQVGARCGSVVLPHQPFERAHTEDEAGSSQLRASLTQPRARRSGDIHRSGNRQGRAQCPVAGTHNAGPVANKKPRRGLMSNPNRLCCIRVCELPLRSPEHPT
jgi:hypothetical protein